MKNKFEVGDVVRTEGLTGHRVGTVEYRDDDPEQVYIYHVRYDNEGCETKEFSMKWHKPEELTLVSGSFDEDVELVEAIDHTGKFKRGDRVRVVSAVLPAHVESIGKEGKIRGVWANGLYRYTIQFDDGDVTLRNFNEVQLELIDERLKFNAGDEVRIVEDDSLYPHERKYIGSKAKIVEVDYDYDPFCEPYPYAVDIPDADDYVWFEESALELVSESDCPKRENVKGGKEMMGEGLKCNAGNKALSPEQQAFDFLFEQDASLVHAYLIYRIRILAKEYLDHKDYVNARRAIDVLERMKE